MSPDFLGMILRYSTIPELTEISRLVTAELAQRASLVSLGRDLVAQPQVHFVPGLAFSKIPENVLRKDIPEPPEGWVAHRAAGCRTFHNDETCPEAPKVGVSAESDCVCTLTEKCLYHRGMPRNIQVGQASPSHQCGACSNGRHRDCSGWCFCPEGPCDGPS